MSTVSPVDDPWITDADVCEWWRVSKQWTQKMRAAGILPHVRIEGLVRYRRADLISFAEKHLVNAQENA